MTLARRTVWLVTWIAALGLWTATPSPAQAQLVRADLRVNGLTCPFCAFGIEKKLRSVDGVQEVEVLLDEGEIRLTLTAENAATVGAFEKAVEAAGFELVGLRVEVRGTVTERDGDPVVEANDVVRFRLLELDDGRTSPASDARLRRIRAKATEGRVSVTGTVAGGRDGLRDLVLDGASEDRGAG